MKPPTTANDNAPASDSEIDFQVVRCEKLADRIVFGGTAGALNMVLNFVEHTGNMDFVEHQLEDFGIADVAGGAPGDLDAARTRARDVLRRLLRRKP